ncbi:MAG: ATP-binding protein [Thermomicrobiales bacterium]
MPIPAPIFLTGQNLAFAHDADTVPAPLTAHARTMDQGIYQVAEQFYVAVGYEGTVIWRIFSKAFSMRLYLFSASPSNKIGEGLSGNQRNITPPTLADWDFQTITQIVEIYELEPSKFDYKVVLNTTDRKDQNSHNGSIRRTVCGMANTEGGFLIFGVRDRHHKVASPIDRIVGIDLDNDLGKEFANKLAAIQPSIQFETSPKPILLPSDPSKGIFVARIPRSTNRPHMVVSRRSVLSTR